MYTIRSSQYNTSEIYIDSVPGCVRARGMLRFIVLFWQLPAVNSPIINNSSGNITLAARVHERSKHRRCALQLPMQLQLIRTFAKRVRCSRPS